MTERRGVGFSGSRHLARDLITRCLDGVASDAEAAELSSLVATDPEAARELARAARLESSLESALRGTAAEVTTQLPAEIQSLRRRKISWTAAVGITAAAAAVVLLWSVVGTHRQPETAASDLNGQARATAPRAARAPEAAPAAADASRRLRFADGSTADLRDGESRLENRLSTAKAVDLLLVQGGARFEVVPRADRRFRVWIASTYVEVLGTIFTVDRMAGGVRVSVERGTVKVVSGRNEMRISAGAAQVIALESPRGRETPDRLEERRRQHSEQAPPPGSGADEPADLLQASEDARRSGHPGDALAPLQRLLDRHPRDPRAPYAAFILGRVLLEELGRPREAAAAFARVEALDPRTPLVQDALAREVESWSRAGDLGQARQRADAYLKRYPSGGRADEVRRYSRME